MSRSIKKIFPFSMAWAIALFGNYSNVNAADKVVVIPLMSQAASTGSIEEIPTVTSATGREWMDRNIGAEKIAGSKSDSLAYGWLYQWGRTSDGHENRKSPITATNNNCPYHGNYITESNHPYDWRTTQKTNPDPVCPSGFAIPTEAEWQAEIDSWGCSARQAFMAYNSGFRFTAAGYRNGTEATSTIENVGISGHYWSQTTNGEYARSLYISNDYNAYMTDTERVKGLSIRCIKTDVKPNPTVCVSEPPPCP